MSKICTRVSGLQFAVSSDALCVGTSAASPSDLKSFSLKSKRQAVMCQIQLWWVPQLAEVERGVVEGSRETAGILHIAASANL